MNTTSPGLPWFDSRKNLADLIEWMQSAEWGGGAIVAIPTVLELLEHPEHFEEEWRQCCDDARAEIARIEALERSYP